ncbi:MAG: di-trans,poly-cis-decaprenylcistransferase [Candidatus Pelagibacter sp. TMED64]|nr:di-trans,poly-cis-decaprenylcistransferase [Candidatus Pelagibacter sp.]OUU67975.1 MAG: di-trans,poly-cis-decaprenylcistransferase [Candidatus Pelagibacter sp. TMED64]|tara:strand:+ start:3522 stop:4193 length:672 start_codon:yes stop_codon:yes gene_type:complete
MNSLHHVAIIMDGNGRWGLKNKNSRNFGHLSGLKNVENIIDISMKVNLKFLTLFVFSTENWRRPKTEVNFLFSLIKNYFKKNLKKILDKDIKIKVIGNNRGIPKPVLNIIKKVQTKTKNNKTLYLNLALNYGSRDEIIKAIKKAKHKKINEKNFDNLLFTKKIPDPDLLIRTGGQKRLSNFLLWQLAYSELFFVDKMWPEFNKNDFLKIINSYKKTKRNYGNI